MIIPHRLITLNITDTSVSAEKFDFYFDDSDRIHATLPQKEFGEDSLQLMAEELKTFDFKKMISQAEIENFIDNVADGINYDLEIATCKYYKLVSYHCPEHYAPTEANNKKFLNIILMLDRHLHFYSPVCAP